MNKSFCCCIIDQNYECHYFLTCELELRFTRDMPRYSEEASRRGRKWRNGSEENTSFVRLFERYSYIGRHDLFLPQTPAPSQNMKARVPLESICCVPWISEPPFATTPHHTFTKHLPHEFNNRTGPTLASPPLIPHIPRVPTRRRTRRREAPTGRRRPGRREATARRRRTGGEGARRGRHAGETGEGWHARRAGGRERHAARERGREGKVSGAALHGEGGQGREVGACGGSCVVLVPGAPIHGIPSGL